MPSEEWDGTNYGPDAPHWYDFKQIGREPWSFRFVDTGLAVLQADPHRFRIKTQLVEDGSRTHRAWGICYEPTSVDATEDDVDERVPIYLGSGSAAISRNNVLAARDSLDSGEEHIVIIREDDSERPVRVPSETIAEMAADEYAKIGLDTDRDVGAVVYTVEDWEYKQDLERSLAEADGDRDE